MESKKKKKIVNIKNNTKSKEVPNQMKAAPKQQHAYHTAWTCTIAPKHRNEKLELDKIITGIMDAMHHISPNIYLKPKPEFNNKVDVLTASNEIPKEDIQLEKYIEQPRMNGSNKLTFRIHLSSGEPTRKTILHQSFRKWMQKEKIAMNISTILTAKPVYAGFWNEEQPENKKITFFEEKIKRLLNNETLDFQVIIAPIFVEGKSNSASVYMVLADVIQAPLIRKQLSVAEEENTLPIFYPWNQYDDLPRAKKLSIIQDQQQNNLQFRNKIISGFTGANPYIAASLRLKFNDDEEIEEEINEECQEQNEIDCEESESEEQEIDFEQVDDTDNDFEKVDDIDNVPEQEETQSQHDMTDNDEEQGQPYLTLTEFIRIAFSDRNDCPYFSKVIGPIDGQVQIQYKSERKNEAESLLEVIKSELARVMTISEIKEAFTEPDSILQEMAELQPWQPYTLADHVQEVATTDTTEQTRHQKAIKRKHRTTTFCITESRTNISNEYTLTNQPKNHQEAVDIPAQIRKPRKEKTEANEKTDKTKEQNKKDNTATIQSISPVTNESPNLPRKEIIDEVTALCTKMIQNAQQSQVKVQQEMQENIRKELNLHLNETKKLETKIDSRIEEMKAEAKTESKRVENSFKMSIRELINETKTSINCSKEATETKYDELFQLNQDMRAMMAAQIAANAQPKLAIPKKKLDNFLATPRRDHKHQRLSTTPQSPMHDNYKYNTRDIETPPPPPPPTSSMIATQLEYASCRGNPNGYPLKAAEQQ
jgi:hypothetical protein